MLLSMRTFHPRILFLVDAHSISPKQPFDLDTRRLDGTDALLARYDLPFVVKAGSLLSECDSRLLQFRTMSKGIISSAAAKTHTHRAHQ